MLIILFITNLLVGSVFECEGVGGPSTKAKFAVSSSDSSLSDLSLVYGSHKSKKQTQPPRQAQFGAFKVSKQGIAASLKISKTLNAHPNGEEFFEVFRRHATHPNKKDAQRLAKLEKTKGGEKTLRELTRFQFHLNNGVWDTRTRARLRYSSSGKSQMLFLGSARSYTPEIACFFEDPQVTGPYSRLVRKGRRPQKSFTLESLGSYKHGGFVFEGADYICTARKGKHSVLSIFRADAHLEISSKFHSGPTISDEDQSSISSTSSLDDFASDESSSSSSSTSTLERTVDEIIDDVDGGNLALVIDTDDDEIPVCKGEEDSDLLYIDMEKFLAHRDRNEDEALVDIRYLFDSSASDVELDEVTETVVEEEEGCPSFFKKEFYWGAPSVEDEYVEDTPVHFVTEKTPQDTEWHILNTQLNKQVGVFLTRNVYPETGEALHEVVSTEGAQGNVLLKKKHISSCYQPDVFGDFITTEQKAKPAKKLSAKQQAKLSAKQKAKVSRP